MSEHHARIVWSRRSRSFDYAEYNRDHEWLLGSGVRITASAAPAFGGDGRSADPEEAFVAAVSACHMLTFLAICARRRIVVDSYEDEAVGFLEKSPEGRLAVTRIELSPVIRFGANAPDESTLAKIHHASHRECFIANSVTTQITVRGAG